MFGVEALTSIASFMFSLRSSEDDKKAPTSKEPYVIFVVDESGSMGQNVNRCYQSVADAMFNLKMSNTEVHVLGFACGLHEIKTDAVSIRKGKWNTQGLTNLTLTIRRLKEILEELSNKNGKQDIKIIFVSDGALSDPSDANSAMDAITNSIESYDLGSIEVCGVALQTGGTPSTSSIAKVMNWNTGFVNELQVIKAGDTLQSEFAKVLTTFLEPTSSYKLEADSDIFMTSYGMQSSIRVSEGSTDINMTRQVPLRLLLNGEVIGRFEPTEGKLTSTTDRASIASYDSTQYSDKFMELGHQIIDTIKVRSVGGRPSEDLLQQVEMIQGFLDANNPTANTTVKVVGENPAETIVLVLKEKLKKRQKMEARLINLARQAANIALVQGLDDAKMQDYLQSNHDISTRMAKRMAETGSGDELTQTIRNDLIKLRNAYNQNTNGIKDIDESTDNCCFITLSGWKDFLDAVSQLTKAEINVLDEAEIWELLTTIPCTACQIVENEYPDSADIAFKNVWAGVTTSIYAIQQSKRSGEQLLHPSTDGKVITHGVIGGDSQYIEFVHNVAPQLLNILQSTYVRGLKSNIPASYIYSQINMIRWFCAQVGEGDHSSVNLTPLRNILQRLPTIIGNYFKKAVDECGECPDNKVMFIDNANISMVIGMLIHQQRENKYNPAEAQRFLMSAVVRECYILLRHWWQQRDDKPLPANLLRKIIGFDYDAFGGVSMGELFEEISEFTERTYKIQSDRIDKTSLCQMRALIQPILEVASVVNGIVGSVSATVDELKKVAVDLTGNLGLGVIKPDKFYFALILQCLKQPVNSDRYDRNTGESFLVSLTSQRALQDLYSQIVNDFMREEYNRRVAQKKAAETTKAVVQMINSMQNASICDFVLLLLKEFTYKGVTVKICNPDSQGFNDLLKMLLEDTTVLDSRKKLMIILLGKFYNPITRKWSDCFNGGNVYRGDLKPFENFFESNGEGKRWKRLMKLYEEWNVYKYRSNQDTNRHGNGNKCPSYWAFGYETVMEYYFSVPDLEWQNYMANHKDCNFLNLYAEFCDKFGKLTQQSAKHWDDHRKTVAGRSKSKKQHKYRRDARVYNRFVAKLKTMDEEGVREFLAPHLHVSKEDVNIDFMAREPVQETVRP